MAKIASPELPRCGSVKPFEAYSGDNLTFTLKSGLSCETPIASVSSLQTFDSASRIRGSFQKRGDAQKHVHRGLGIKLNRRVPFGP